MKAISKLIYDFSTNKIWKNTATLLFFYICQQREFYISLPFRTCDNINAVNSNYLSAINKRQTPYVAQILMEDLWKIFLVF